MGIHDEHPFMPDPGDRDPVRRFRGMLAAPVTIVTSATPDQRAGLTVSSLVVIEGDPGEVHLLIGPNSDLWDVVTKSGRFVVHVCRSGQRGLAEVFAGRQPSPGGVFAGLTVTETEWGPVVEDISDRLYATVISIEAVGWSGVVRGRVDQVEVGSTTDPLVYFRGRYRNLG
jgi:3-hydroxy-9,10-secoandrosta-1,3,5(10)-triene-9,17-dione monooxygenase reductase component